MKVHVDFMFPCHLGTEECAYWFLAKNPPKGVKIEETISPLAKSIENAVSIRLQVEKIKDTWSSVAEVHFSRKLLHASKPFRVCSRLQVGPNTPILGAYPLPRSRYHYITVSPATAGGLDFWATEVEELSEGFISLIQCKELK